MKKSKLPHDVYASSVWLVWGSYRELRDFLARSLPEHAEALPGNCGGLSLWRDEEDGREYFILLPTLGRWTRAATVAFLAHECAHVANWVLHDHGVKWKPKKDEAFTYYLQWLVFNCLYLMWGKAGR